MKLLLLAASLLAPVEWLDASVQHVVQEARRPALEAPARFLSDRLGTPAAVLGALLAVCVIEGPPGVETARLAVLTLIPLNLTVEAVKRATFRTRPDGERKRSNASFPSSHAANAIALAALLSRRRRRLAPLFWTLAVAVALSRIYLNRHWFSDVAAGAVWGLGCVWIVAAAWDGRRRRFREVSSRSPAEGTFPTRERHDG